MPKKNFCAKREKIVGMIIIKNGTIIDPVSERLYRADLEIKEGRIDKITVQEETAEYPYSTVSASHHMRRDNS